MINMNSFSCMNVILKNIQDNAHLFEKNKDIKNLSEIICRLGGLAVKKSLPCAFLKNILVTLKKLNDNNIITDFMYKSFLKDINCFYKSQNLCDQYKLTILSCFTPAVEIELLYLLKLCATVPNISELDSVKSAVENSVLVQACVNSKTVVQKVVKILKGAFIRSEGNPVVGYLTFQLFKLIEQPCYPILLPGEMYSLSIYFHFPHNLLTGDEQELFIKQFMNMCMESINLNLCTKMDLLFYIAVFPALYYKMLRLSTERISDNIVDFLRFLCISEKLETLDFINDIGSASENVLWKFILD